MDAGRAGSAGEHSLLCAHDDQGRHRRLRPQARLQEDHTPSHGRLEERHGRHPVGASRREAPGDHSGLHPADGPPRDRTHRRGTGRCSGHRSHHGRGQDQVHELHVMARQAPPLPHPPPRGGRDGWGWSWFPPLFALFGSFCLTSVVGAATWVYTANESGGTVSVIDADAGKKRATIRGLRAPHNIHLGRDGMLYLTDGPANQAVKVDPDKLRIVARWEVGKGPAHIFMTPDQRQIVNTNTESGDVMITDASTLQLLATIPVGKSPHGLAISPDGKFAYVANLGSKDLAVVDLKEQKLAATIPLDDAAVQAWAEPQGKFVYVTGLNTGQVIKIDAAARKVVARLPVGKLPAQLGVTPDGKYLISCDQESAQLSIYDAATDTLVKQLPLGTWTHGISFSQDSKYAFVTNTNSDDVSVVDLVSLTEVKRIKVGKGPNGIAASYPNTFPPAK